MLFARACAALDIQHEITALAGEVRGRDGIDLRLRIGLNSGQVIAGDIDSGPGVTPPSASTSGWPSGWSRPHLPAG